MAQLFRKKALTKLMSREQLDEPVRNLFLKVRMAGICAGVTLALGLAWTFGGSLPEEGQGRGIMMTPNTIVPVQAQASGQLKTWSIRVGELVEEGQVIGELDQPAIEQELRQALLPALRQALQHRLTQRVFGGEVVQEGGLADANLLGDRLQ